MFSKFLSVGSLRQDAKGGVRDKVPHGGFQRRNAFDKSQESNALLQVKSSARQNIRRICCNLYRVAEKCYN